MFMSRVFKMAAVKFSESLWREAFISVKSQFEVDQIVPWTRRFHKSLFWTGKSFCYFAYRLWKVAYIPMSSHHFRHPSFKTSWLNRFTSWGSISPNVTQANQMMNHRISPNDEPSNLTKWWTTESHQMLNHRIPPNDKPSNPTKWWTTESHQMMNCRISPNDEPPNLTKWWTAESHQMRTTESH